MKKLELQQIIREEINKVLNEGFISNFFRPKPSPPKPSPSKSTPTKTRPPYLYNEKPVTIEGLSLGYTVWAGDDPVGDSILRTASQKQIKSTYGDANDKRYYLVVGVRDSVDRPAYFAVSTPKSAENKASDEDLKKIADKILQTNPTKRFFRPPSLQTLNNL